MVCQPAFFVVKIKNIFKNFTSEKINFLKKPLQEKGFFYYNIVIAILARWPSGKAAVCKTAIRGFDSRSRLIRFFHCGRSSMVEPQFSKLMTRVRFPSPACKDCWDSSVGRASPW